MFEEGADEEGMSDMSPEEISGMCVSLCSFFELCVCI